MVTWRDTTSPTPCAICRRKVQGQDQRQRCCLKPGLYREFKRERGSRSFAKTQSPCRSFAPVPFSPAPRREWRPYAD